MTIAFERLRVAFAFWLTRAIFSPSIQFIMVLLPALGRPIRATNPALLTKGPEFQDAMLRESHDQA